MVYYCGISIGFIHRIRRCGISKVFQIQAKVVAMAAHYCSLFVVSSSLTSQRRKDSAEVFNQGRRQLQEEVSSHSRLLGSLDAFKEGISASLFVHSLLSDHHRDHKEYHQLGLPDHFMHLYHNLYWCE